MRIFIAFPLPKDVREKALELQKIVQKQYPRIRVRPVAEKAMHVTVAFLGERTSEEVKQVRDILRYQTDRSPAFLSEFVSVGAFPSLIRPQTVVTTVTHGRNGEGREFQKALHERLSLHGLVEPPDKEWRPHITLLRVKEASPQPMLSLKELSVPSVTWSVDTVELIQSALTATGPEYTILESFSLRS